MLSPTFTLSIHLHSLHFQSTQKMASRNKRHSNPYPPWSELPSKLLSTIANFLTSTPFDIQSFRSVCNSWHSSSSNPFNSSNLCLQLPLKIPCPPSFFPTTCPFSDSDFCLISVTSIIALHPSKNDENGQPLMPSTWVLFLDQSNHGKVRVRDPFNKSYSMPLDFPTKLNLFDFHAVELGRFYNLNYLKDQTGDVIENTKQPLYWSATVLKVVLLNNFGVVVLFDKGILGLFRFGVVDAVWEVLHDGKGFRFDDIVEFRGRVLGIDRSGRVFELDLGELKMNLVCNSSIARGAGKRKRLVDSFGVLNLVVRCTARKSTDKLSVFKVYEFNERKKKWTPIKSIGGRILFFGSDFSVCIPAKHLRGSFVKSCIVYKAISFRCYLRDAGIDDDFLYKCIGDQSLCMGIWHWGDASIESIASFPGYTDVFWPPPAWIWPDDKSRRLGLLATAMERLLTGMADENLKAQWKELSPMVESLGFYENWNRRNLQGFIMQSQTLHKFLKDIYLEIDKEVDRIKDDLEKELEEWHLGFKNRFRNQGTPIHTDESKEWIANAWKGRLNAHEEVKAILKTLFQFIENYSSDIENYRRSLEQASAVVVAETGYPKSK